MKPLYTEKEFNEAKSLSLLTCECYQCGNEFKTTKSEISKVLKKQRNAAKFCSRECGYKNKILEKTKFTCDFCGIEFEKLPNQVKNYTNHFCSHSCVAKHTNKYKSNGYKRSRLEKWLEEHLKIIYPDLHIDYNQKYAIESELDIHIPSLNLAIELNGIVHYEPIYGVNKLNQIQLNDLSKSKCCSA